MRFLMEDMQTAHALNGGVYPLGRKAPAFRRGEHVKTLARNDVVK